MIFHQTHNQVTRLLAQGMLHIYYLREALLYFSVDLEKIKVQKALLVVVFLCGLQRPKKWRTWIVTRFLSLSGKADKENWTTISDVLIIHRWRQKNFLQHMSLSQIQEKWLDFSRIWNNREKQQDKSWLLYGDTWDDKVVCPKSFNCVEQHVLDEFLFPYWR